ncbi:glycosyltransferase [Mariniblastus sp.]|nr:glycosyltransferase [Mariniblastus sp.]
MPNSTIHIVHVIDDLASTGGGTSRAVVNLTSHLSAIEGCLCSIFAKATDESQLVHDPRVAVCYADQQPNQRLVHESLATLHREKPIDVIHTNGIWSPFIHSASSFARRNKIKLVATPHGMLEPWSLSQKKWKKKIAWWTYQRNDLKNADAIQVTAESEAMSVRNLGLNKCIMVPNGVDIRPLPQNIDRKPTALFLSRVHPKKGIPILISAWEKLNRKDWELLIVGPGDLDYLKQIQNQIDNLADRVCVKLLPPVDGADKDLLYESASLFVLPTHSENFGIVVAEALERELPVITTTGTPWTELDSVGCGWCIELSEQNLIQAIESAQRLSPQERRKMGVAGREYVTKNFAWPAIASKLVDYYRQIINESN